MGISQKILSILTDEQKRAVVSAKTPEELITPAKEPSAPDCFKGGIKP